MGNNYWYQSAYLDTAKERPPTESQMKVIETMKTNLDNAGIDHSFIVDPENNFTAHYVINALIKLCRKNGVTAE